MHLTELQTRILESLSIYRFLTASQFLRIGVSASLRVIWRSLRKLTQTPTEKRPLVGRIRFPVQARISGVESFHYLTPRGAGLLAEVSGVDSSNIDAVHRPVLFTRDYIHRKACIDFHISLRQAIESSNLSLALFDRYFEPATAKARTGRFAAKTRVEISPGRFIIPDINFILRSQKDPQRQALFSVEVQNGVDTKRALQKIRLHKKIIQCGALGKKHRLTLNNQALFLFDQRSLLQAVLTRLAEAEIDGFEHLFWLGLAEHIERDPLGLWLRASDTSNYRNFITGKER